MFKNFLVLAVLILVLSFNVDAAFKRDVYDYQGSNLRQKVNYSLLDANNVSVDEYFSLHGIMNTRLVMIIDESNLDLDAISVTNNNSLGAASIDLNNAEGDMVEVGVFSRTISQAVFPNFAGTNQSVGGMVCDNNGGGCFVASRNGGDILIGISPDSSLANIEFIAKFDNETSSMILQEELSLAPIRIDGGFGLALVSNESLVAGGIPHLKFARDADGNLMPTSADQNGVNNSFTYKMNSFGPLPKDWILNQTPENFSLEDYSPNSNQSIEFVFNITNYPKYCDYQQSKGFIVEGCKFFADTEGQGGPLLHTHNLEVHDTAVMHNGLNLFHDFDFVDRDDDDFDITWTNTSVRGKVHIRDQRFLEENITSFDVVINDFDNELSPFVSETIASEVGRDWRITLDTPDECFNDECAKANGGVEKILSFTGDTTFQNGAVASNNTRFLFYIATDLQTNDNLSLIIDDNIGNTSLLLNITTTTALTLYNVSIPAIFENKSNVTTSFFFNGQNVNSIVWVDQFRVTSEPAETIEFNEPYEGGKIVLGSDIDASNEVGFEKIKFVNNATQLSEFALNLIGPNLYFNGAPLNVSGGGGTSNHAALSNLEQANSGHTYALSNQELNIGSYNLTTTGRATVNEINITTPAVDCLSGTFQIGDDGLTRTCATVLADDVQPGDYPVGDYTYRGQVRIQDGSQPALVIGADTGGTTLTDATFKIGRMATPHYTLAEEDVGIFLTNNNPVANFLQIGGGSVLFNAVTQIDFFTAADITTVRGTERMSIESDGLISMFGDLNVNNVVFIDTFNNHTGINDLTPGEALDVNGNINVSAGFDICIKGGNCLSSATGNGTGGANATTSLPAENITSGTFLENYSFTNNVNFTENNITDITCVRYAGGMMTGKC